MRWFPTGGKLAVRTEFAFVMYFVGQKGLIRREGEQVAIAEAANEPIANGAPTRVVGRSAWRNLPRNSAALCDFAGVKKRLGRAGRALP